MTHPVFNPYLPSWEYIPDGEPHVFGDRVYVYGSHDWFDGYVFCSGDYVCWSCPVTDPGAWRYEGVIYPRLSDPINKSGRMNLYAPDVTQGPDGRYYLYYVYDKVNIVSVAVCDTPAGQYQFLGYVHDKDGNILGKRPGDEPQFDPGVLTEGDKTYMYTGFCGHGDKGRHGSMCTVLDRDMLTILEEPRFVVPGAMYSEGTGYEGHAFFEASSIRKMNGRYYFVYSSTVMHELCYATAADPRGPFTFGGVLVSNNDIGIDTYKDAGVSMAYGGNNHGGMVQFGGKTYIFYHRQTNATHFSRQGCAEEIHIAEDGSIKQVEITSCGLNGGPLPGKGEYPAYIACHLYTPAHDLYSGVPGQPYIRQDGKDGDEELGYICHFTDGAAAGFRYFDLTGTKHITIATRAYCHGEFHVSCTPDGEALCRIPVESSNIWENASAECDFPEGIHSLYFTYHGTGTPSLKGFVLA